MVDESAVFAVETSIGLVNIVIGGVNQGSAWIDGEVIVNRIPHKVSAVEWGTAWDGKIRASAWYGIRRIDTPYPEQTTRNSYQKITEAIEAAVAQVMEQEGPRFQHYGRLTELRSARNVHESEASRLRSQAEDLIKQAVLEEQAVQRLDETLESVAKIAPGDFDAMVESAYGRGVAAAQAAIAGFGDIPENERWSPIFDIEREHEEELRAIERATPVAHITECVKVAYLRGYIKTCSDARAALQKAEYERWIAERRAQAVAN